MWQLGAKKRSLDRVEPKVAPDLQMLTAHPRAVLAKPSAQRGEILAVGGDEARIAQRPQDLGRKEAEAPTGSPCAHRSPEASRAEALGCILDDRDPVTV